MLELFRGATALIDEIDWAGYPARDESGDAWSSALELKESAWRAWHILKGRNDWV